MSENISFIPSRLKNAAVGGHVAGTVDIYDDDIGATQAKVNQDRIDAEDDLDHKIDNLDGRLSPQIEENTENIELIRQEITDVPVTSEVDPYPTEDSTHPVMSGGVWVKNIQAEIVVGDPQGDWNPSTAEEMFERDQARINILEAELQAAQLEIGAVQTDSVPTEDSVNMLPSGAIFTNCAVAGTKVGEI